VKHTEWKLFLNKAVTQKENGTQTKRNMRSNLIKNKAFEESDTRNNITPIKGLSFMIIIQFSATTWELIYTM
jgi:hypothetical protein